MIDFENKKVLFIDLDGTLIKTISGKTFPEDITDFRIQLSVLNKIIEKLPNIKRFCIVTNQGGLKSVTAEWEFKAKLHAIEDICCNYLANRLTNFLDSDAEYCPSMDKANPYRKPHTGMLQLMCSVWGVQNKQEMLMIGDASGKPGDFSDSDKECAENFGIDYIDVRDFLEL